MVALVYVNAFAPAEGESAFQLAGPDSALAVPDPTTVFDLVPAALPPTADSVRADRQLQATTLLVRRLFRDDPGLEQRLLGEIDHTKSTDGTLDRQLRTLISLYGDADGRLLNFYGPAGTIHLVPYDQVLAASQLSVLPPARLTPAKVELPWSRTQMS